MYSLKQKKNSNSCSKPQKNPLLHSQQQKAKYTQLNTSQYHSLNKSQGHSSIHNRKPSLSINTSSQSITKQITSKKNVLNHNRSFSINQSLNNSRVNPVSNLNLTTTGNCCTNMNKRKKTLTVNVNNDLMLTESTFKEKNKNEPLKLYNDSSALISETEINYLSNVMNELDKKLSYNLSQIKNNSKSMKYNTIKATFEQLIKAFPKEQQKLLIKLLKGYHEVVFAFANENKSLKEANEIKHNTFLSIDKEQIELRKAIKEKDKEIELLKQKLKEKSEQIVSKSTNESIMVSSNGKEQLSDCKKDETDKIEIYNKNNIEDLDALYFFDKVKMNSDNSEQNVPVLNFRFEETKKKKSINKNISNNHSMNNIKFRKVFK